MKDGRTHLAHTAEHAVDLETGAIVGVTVQDADDGDTTTMVETLLEAAAQIAAVEGTAGVTEVVGDKGYHSNETMVAFRALGIRSYVSEPDRGRRNWKGKAAAQQAVYANRRRIRGSRAGNNCCGSEASCWNVPTRISTKPGGCVGCICVAIPTP